MYKLKYLKYKTKYLELKNNNNKEYYNEKLVCIDNYGGMENSGNWRNSTRVNNSGRERNSGRVDRKQYPQKGKIEEPLIKNKESNMEYKMTYSGNWKITDDGGWNDDKTIFTGLFICNYKNIYTNDNDNKTFIGKWYGTWNENNTNFNGVFDGKIINNNNNKTTDVIYNGEWYGKWNNDNTIYNGEIVTIPKPNYDYKNLIDSIMTGNDNIGDDNNYFIFYTMSVFIIKYSFFKIFDNYLNIKEWYISRVPNDIYSPIYCYTLIYNKIFNKNIKFPNYSSLEYNLELDSLKEYEIWNFVEEIYNNLYNMGIKDIIFEYSVVNGSIIQIGLKNNLWNFMEKYIDSVKKKYTLVNMNIENIFFNLAIIHNINIILLNITNEKIIIYDSFSPENNLISLIKNTQDYTLAFTILHKYNNAIIFHNNDNYYPIYNKNNKTIEETLIHIITSMYE